MALKKKKKEIERLIDVFEREANKFHDIGFNLVYFYANEEPSLERFKSKRHAVMLWQHYGALGTDNFLENLKTSDLQWGMRGAKVSCFALIEGEARKLFVKMALRAVNILNKGEKKIVKTRVLNEINKKLLEEDDSQTIASVVNDNNLAVWLNYLLYHISKTNPGIDNHVRIDPDPFTLSLLALEDLLEEPEIKKADKSIRNVEGITFKAAFSFPGERRAFVSKVAKYLRKNLGPDELFYDYDYQSQLARPNLDTLLQKIYGENTNLIVVFLSSEYEEKEWCGLEWRVVRDIIKSKKSNNVMLIRFDNSKIEGLLSIDGSVDVNAYSEKGISKLILERIKLLEG